MSLKPLLLALSLAAACARTPAPPPTPLTAADSTAAASVARLRADVAWLAAPARAGRPAGSLESRGVARFLAARYDSLGIAGAFGATYFQGFRAPDGEARNVAARVAGADPAVTDEVVIVGAHSDHVGRAASLALDPERGPVVRPGADDNASGTAAVLELARRLAARPPRRSVLVAHFDAEELGLLGSQAFVDRSPVPRGKVRLMLNLDMVGRLRGDRLQVEIAHRHEPLAPIVERAALASGLRVDYTLATSGRSDHATFAEWRVPAVALFTGYHDDYHAATDIPARVNAVGLRRVVDVAERIVREVADQ